MAVQVEKPSLAERAEATGFDMEATMNEALQGAAADEIVSKDGDPTPDELRDALGDEAEGLSDEQLVEAWQESQKSAVDTPAEPAKPVDAPKVDTPPADSQEAWERPWSFSGLDTKTALGLVDKKIKFPVDGKDVERSIDDLIRQSQRLPTEQRRLAEVTQQRNEQAVTVKTLTTENVGLKNDRETWFQALRDPTGQLFQKLQEKFLEQGVRAPASRTAAQADGDSDETSEVDQLRGELVYKNEIWPGLHEHARGYGWQGASPDAGSIAHLEKEIDRVARDLISAEGAFITPERVRQIVSYDIPNMLLEAGWTNAGGRAAVAAPANAPVTKDPEKTRLLAENANLKAQVAKQRVAEAPDAGSGPAPGSSASSTPSIEGAKSWRDIRNVLRDPESFQNLPD